MARTPRRSAKAAASPVSATDARLPVSGRCRWTVAPRALWRPGLHARVRKLPHRLTQPSASRKRLHSRRPPADGALPWCGCRRSVLGQKGRGDEPPGGEYGFRRLGVAKNPEKNPCRAAPNADTVREMNTVQMQLPLNSGAGRKFLSGGTDRAKPPQADLSFCGTDPCYVAVRQGEYSLS